MTPRLNDAEYQSPGYSTMEDLVRNDGPAKVHKRFTLEAENVHFPDGSIEYYLTPESTAEIADNLVAYNLKIMPMLQKQSELARLLKSLKTKARDLTDHTSKVGAEHIAAVEDDFEWMVNTLSKYGGTDMTEATRLARS